jgi:RimJ/RimL family protein N-acetyltransferase
LAGEDDEMRLRFEAPRRPTLSEVAGAIQRWQEGRATGSPMFAYAVRLGDGTLIGGCELRRPSSGLASVSYWIYPPFRQQGYAARALSLVCDAAAKLEGLDLIEAHIDPDNAASRAVAQAAGFVADGTTEDESDFGPPITRLVYVRTCAGGQAGRPPRLTGLWRDSCQSLRVRE